MSSVDGSGGALRVRLGALAPPRTVAIRELRYRQDAFGESLAPVLGRHPGKKAQIVSIYRRVSALRPKVAHCAMRVQDERRIPATGEQRAYIAEDAVESRGVVGNPDGFASKIVAVDQRAGFLSVPVACNNERAPKQTSRLSDSSGFSHGEKRTGTTRLSVAGFRVRRSADARCKLTMLQTAVSQSNQRAAVPLSASCPKVASSDSSPLSCCMRRARDLHIEAIPAIDIRKVSIRWALAKR